MSTGPQRARMYERIRRLTLEELEGWEANLKGRGTEPGRPYPDEERELWKRRQVLKAEGKA